MFAVGPYIGFVEIFDDKIFGLADVLFWNRDTGKKYFFHRFMTGRRRFIPISTGVSATTSFRRSRYIRISWNRARNRITLTFNMRGNSSYPSVSGHLHASFDNPHLKEFVSVTPAPTTSRCSATWIVSTPSHGCITIKKDKRQPGSTMADSPALSCMVLNRMFYKTHTTRNAACGLGTIDERAVIFRFANTTADAVDSDTYNDNLLTVDGDATLMPPVMITRPFGGNKNWVVQDTESMVDLTFTPISINRRLFHIFFFHTVYDAVYGLFNGFLLTRTGEKIVLKDFPGIVTSNTMRI